MAIVPPICPRCGYDQTGVVETWQDVCPIDGTCSECGLAFRWVDVLDPDRIIPSHSFEHARRMLPLALLVTLYRILHPGLYWNVHKLEHPVRPGRLGVLVACMLLFSVVLWFSAFCVTHEAIYGYWPESPDLRWMIEFAIFGSPVPWLLAWWAVTPGTFLLLPTTMRRARVRRRHLLRLWAGLSGVSCLAAAAQVTGYFIWDMFFWEWRIPVQLAFGAIPVAWSIYAVWCASRRYLRLEQPLAVTLAMTIVGGLIAAVLIVTLWMIEMQFGYPY